MSVFKTRLAAAASALALAASCPPNVAVAVAPVEAERTNADTCPVAEFPGSTWSRGDAAGQGWDAAGLERARQYAEASHYASGVLIHRGRIIWKFGDLDQPYETRSIRKSLYNALIGQVAAEGRLNLDASLAELGIDDRTPPLTAREKTATVRDLLMSRSGVYHDAAHMARGDFEGRPPRGSKAPGEHFWYNNWDFNTLAVITERALGENLFAAFDRRIARPIGMQDFVPAHGRKHYDRDVSIHPAYLFDMSARDRARFGWLYLNDGCWEGRRLVPPGWVRTSTAPLTERAASGSPDYGYLWWSQRGVGDMQGRLIMARGNAHQYITLIPESGAVLVMVNDMGYPGWINWIRTRLGLMGGFDDYGAVLREVVRARPRSAPASSISATPTS